MGQQTTLWKNDRLETQSGFGRMDEIIIITVLHTKCVRDSEYENGTDF